MVLSPSDYSLPEPGEQMDPTKPTGFASRFAGMVVVLSVVAFAWQIAKNRGASFLNDTVGNLTGGLVSSDGSGGGDDPWEGV